LMDCTNLANFSSLINRGLFGLSFTSDILTAFVFIAYVLCGTSQPLRMQWLSLGWVNIPR
jgi:hypothetical protein